MSETRPPRQWLVTRLTILYDYFPRQERRDQGDEHADMDFKDLKRLTVECEGWIRTSRLLIQDVMGEDFVFEDASVGVKKGTDKVESTDSKTTVIEVRVLFQLTFDLFGMFIDLCITKF